MYLSVQEIAKKFGVTKTGVYYWIRQGLPYKTERIIKRKTRKIIDPRDVVKFLGIDDSAVNENGKPTG